MTRVLLDDSRAATRRSLLTEVRFTAVTYANLELTLVWIVQTRHELSHRP
jgi:hypothetical protein